MPRSCECSVYVCQDQADGYRGREYAGYDVHKIHIKYIWLFCGIFPAGFTYHTQCLFHVFLAQGHVLIRVCLVPHGLALCIQRCVRTFAVDGHVLVVQFVVFTGAVALGMARMGG